jgi:hypothetical protein
VPPGRSRGATWEPSNVSAFHYGKHDLSFRLSRTCSSMKWVSPASARGRTAPNACFQLSTIDEGSDFRKELARHVD